MTIPLAATHKSGAYRPDIDGLRAVAVLAVVLYHAFPSLLPGGFIGVDVFFVISGYLISRIIHNDLDSSEYSIAKFYSRRIRRIFPALLVVLITAIVAGWGILLPTEFRQLGKHLAGCAVFLSNFVLWKESGYFNVASETKPLLHLWSLAVEEQFYLVWPLLMAWIWRRRWNFLGITSILIVASFGANLYLVYNDPGAAYFFPFARFWELLAGAMIAHLHRKRYEVSAVLTQISGYIGIFLLGSGFVLIDKSSRFPGWWAVLPTIGTVLIIASGRVCWVNFKILGSKPFVWIGLISYPLYLWHWPIFSYLRINFGDEPSVAIRVLAIFLSVALAYLTFQLVEKRVRHKSSKAVIPLLLAGLVGAGGAGLLFYSRLFQPRLSSEELQKVLDASTEWTFPGRLTPVENTRGAYGLATGREQTTAYIGDSHMAQYADRISLIAKRHPTAANSVLMLSRGGCPPIPGVHQDADPGCRSAVDRMYQATSRTRVNVVVVGGCWNCYFEDALAGRAPHGKYEISFDGKTLPMGSEAGWVLALSSLEEKLRALAKTKTVYLVLDNPRGPELDPWRRISGHRIGSFNVSPAPDSVPVDSVELRIRGDLVAMAHRIGINALDPRPSLCSETRCVASFPDGSPIYKDDHHLRAPFVRDRAAFIDAPLMPSERPPGSTH